MTKTILIVDDSSSIRSVVGMTLKNEGYEVLSADDGSTALKLLDGRKIHLIVSDVNMPIMDGISFIKAAKKLAPYAYTPVMMLTTETQESKKEEGKQAGAKAWLIKPFKPEVLLSAVSKLA